MARLTKKQKEAVAKIDKSKFYSLSEASALVKEISNAKFDASVDIAVNLAISNTVYLGASPPFTVIPIDLAVPATIFIAESIVNAFKSTILSSAIVFT